ncbi:MAG: hypothetical protein ACD_51C00248G0005 [uncultured bacterium]|nr:MAG: hypothetical protein ACD_51C00248G0005 [uncultured bacterium]OGJ47817.1 MAG: hypothetical protein A2244_04255 [Candidatus Peregrinibacteria bacterium RIFOXYA2_FULL_41_18]OGJ48373.1 MAG: hypothetical protein A2344_05205 [Candidatus Peregrinibacteria bacterium RIFOXYB12_FULL_41_12]OGJ53012.1 MAG: hypothetical protein A2448_04375 [Candidatus Peregrinibacteria bacterium RIFOXYC2_FULL_41_22]OGJ55220.1 MAG: hypothetical protein A2336_03555 [Candidatus Peregrinibacteria bacterium RIFOXYB2_FULL
MNTPKENNFSAETPLPEALEKINAHLREKGLPELTAEDLECISSHRCGCRTIDDLSTYGHWSDLMAVFKESNAPLSKLDKTALSAIVYELSNCPSWITGEWESE